jgi:chitinase
VGWRKIISNINPKEVLEKAPLLLFTLPMKVLLSLFLLLISVFTFAQNDIKVIGYVAGWKNVDPSTIDANKFTHINYAFANVVNGMVSEGEGFEERDIQNIKALHTLKKSNPNLKILISIGGWTWSGGFSDAVLTENSRKKFTDSAIAYLIKHDLDGLDFDWEYPGLKGNDNTFRKEDKENFVFMLKSVRNALDSLSNITGKYYLNTIASAGFLEYLEVNDLAQAQQYLDFVNIMTYDFIGIGDQVTGHHSNLYSSFEGQRSADLAVRQHIAAGVPPQKLVLGLAFYGKAWQEVNPQNDGLYQEGKWLNTYAYHKIREYINHPDYLKKWDEKTKTPFLWNPNKKIFLTYENIQSIQEKVDYVKSNQLGGVMFWEYSEDYQEELLNAIHMKKVKQ